VPVHWHYLAPTALPGELTLTGGTLNINNAQALGTTAGTFSINNGTIIDNTTAGAITTLNYPMAWNGDFTFTGTQNLNLGTGTITLNSDRQVTVGAGTLTAAGTINAGTRNFTKAGSGTLSFGSNTVTLRSLTINAGTLTATSGTMNLSGNFSNNGTFNANNGTVTFTGSLTQSIGGSSSTAFHNLLFSKTAGAVTFNLASTINNNFSIASGSVANLGTYAHTAETLTLGGVGRANGSWGHPSSPATHKNDVYFANATGILNVNTGTCTAPAFTYSQTNVTCFGGNDGSITVTVNTGIPNYEFSKDGGTTWTAPQTSNIYTFGSLTVAGGPYSIRVRDGSGCVQAGCP
jgi:hypothetical protein